MQFIDVYKEVKALLKKMARKDYFEKYDSENLFYLFDDKSKAILSFSTAIMANSYGIQLFKDRNGVNYLYDILHSNTGFSMSPCFTDSYIVALVKRADLSRLDKFFLKEMGIRVVAENVVCYHFKDGYGEIMMTARELSKVLDYLYYLYSLLQNEMLEIDEAFLEDKMAIACFDPKEMTYAIQYRQVLDFQDFPRFKSPNKGIIEDFSDSIYASDICHIAHCYLPITKQGRYYQSILLVYYEIVGDYKYVVIDCKPEKICEYVYGFIDDCFKTMGLPTAVVINHRGIYSLMNKTLKELNIEVEFERENEEVDNLFYEIINEKLEEMEEATSVNSTLVA